MGLLKLHNCLHHGRWEGTTGQILACSICGEMIGIKSPKIFNSNVMEFTPMSQQAKVHEDEIRERYGIPRIESTSEE